MNLKSIKISVCLKIIKLSRFKKNKAKKGQIFKISCISLTQTTFTE